MGLILAGTALGGRLAGLDMFDLIVQASWIAKLVLLLLALISIVSWAVIVFKWRELRRATQDSEAFLEVYHEGSLDRAYAAARQLDGSPLAEIFLAGYSEAGRIARYAEKASARGLDEAQMRRLSREIEWTASRQGLRLERGLSLLATAGSASPFIGLFGTVIGIINAFHNIGQAGTASLAVVAPGIAEALIATAVGLFAAIPATIAYNFFVGTQLRSLTTAIELFGLQFQDDLRRVGAAVEAPPVRRAGS
jgi:biopolymer transport protein TolQ